MLLKIAAMIFFASTTTTPGPQPVSKQTQKIEPPSKCEGRTFASAEEAMQSGCCSHHGGVCGCQGDRKVCCDGKLSPSCKC